MTDYHREQARLLDIYWTRRERHAGPGGYCTLCRVTECPPHKEAYYYTTFQDRHRNPPMTKDARSGFIPPSIRINR